jgi:hypothetical protein
MLYITNPLKLLHFFNHPERKPSMNNTAQSLTETTNTSQQLATPILPEDVASIFETFTKEEARALLDNKNTNRKRRRNIVNQYRDTMNNGNWINRCRTASPIIIDEDGKLRGGQHRLEAFWLSNLSAIEFPVARNVSKEEQPYQDGNIPRTVRDRVNMFEELPVLKNINNTTIVAASKIIVDHKNAINNSKLDRSDPKTIAQAAKEFESTLVVVDLRLTKESLIVKSAPAVAAFLVAHDLMEKAKWEFCLDKTSNFENLQLDDPMYRFRDFASKLPTSYTNGVRWEVFQKSLFCLRAQQNAEKIKSVLAQKTVLDTSTWKK